MQFDSSSAPSYVFASTCEIPFIISKVETLNALKNFSKISKASNATLLDRGDLSRYIAVEKIPIIQLNLLKQTKKINKPMYVATNLLESMVNKPSPTRAESNDIFFTLFSGAKGLVLAAETAIGKYPLACASFIKKCLIKSKFFFVFN